MALFLLCLQDPFPQISAMGSAGTSAISSMMTSKVKRCWYLKHYLPFGARNQGLLPYTNYCSTPEWSGPFGLVQVQLIQSKCRLDNLLSSFPWFYAAQTHLQLHRNPGEIFHGTSWQFAAYLFLSNQPIQLSPQRAWKSPSTVQVRPRGQPFFSLGVFYTPGTSWSSTKRNAEVRQVLSFSSLWQLLTKRLGRVTGLKRHCPSGKEKGLLGKSEWEVQM